MKKFIILIICFMSSSLFSRGSDSTFTFFPYFNMGYVGLTDVNDSIYSAATENGLDPSEIHLIMSFGGFFGYRFNHRYNVGLVFDYNRGSSYMFRQEESAFNIVHPEAGNTTGLMYEYATGFSTIGLGPAFYFTILNYGKLSLDAFLSILYILKVSYYADTTFGDTEADLNNANNLYQVSGSGSTYAIGFGVSGVYYFTNYLGASLDLGYRLYGKATLKDSNGNVVPFIYADGTADGNLGINLSGFYFGVAVRGEFDFSGSSSYSRPKPKEKEDTWEAEPFYEEESVDWEEETTAPVIKNVEGPSLSELEGLKKEAKDKWYQNRSLKTPDAQQKAIRYERLYDIINRLEKDWNHFTPDSRKEKISKIKNILNY